ncbi:MAG TPA: DUF882 domain-containing protein [Steroidobacteraceae bacterium]|nr:DUF882 domain-containing protein [Steroidobacteraceae bacterium]
MVAAGGVLYARLAVAADEPDARGSVPLERHLELHNTHTGETASVMYRRGEEYQDPAIAALRHVMRDHRNDTAHDIDLALYDQLYDLAVAAGCPPYYEIISGYRSPESNAKMAARPGSGVAKHSLHMEGRAIDVRLHQCPCADLRDLAISAARGGVGHYRRSDFVHLDTGRVRTWNG